MALLIWNDRHTIGNAAVDHEHRKLVDLINRLYDKASARDTKSAGSALFGDLLRDTSAHFALEERFMRDHKYERFFEHKDHHEKLLDEIRDIMDAYEAEEMIDSAALAKSLEAWFTIHLETHDVPLHSALGAPVARRE